MPRADAQHLMLEASRLAFADRGAYIADRRFFVVPRIGLLSKDFAATRRALIGDQRRDEPGGARRSVSRSTAGDARAGEAVGDVDARGHDDAPHGRRRRGNVVSYTFTIESTGGAGLVVPGYGFLLNNELTDFNFTSRTHPNRVQGGKRPRSSMAPTIVLRGGRPWLGLGSPGGSTIITTVLGLLVDRIDFGMPLPLAIAAPRASQRDTPATRRRARVPQVAGGRGARRARARVHADGRDRRGDRRSSWLGRGDGRGGRAGAARRRQRARGDAHGA